MRRPDFFWVGYQFEVRPGVGTDFEVVDSQGAVYISMDGTSMMLDPPHETRELGLIFLFDVAREHFIRAEVYNLKRKHEFSGYPVYWAGRIGNEESLSYLKSIIDSSAPELNRLSDIAIFAVALHDDVRRALSGIARNDNVDGAATYLIRTAESEKDLELRKSAISALGRVAGQKSLGALTNTTDNDVETELQKQAVIAIGRRPKDESVPVLIRVARTHSKMAVRKQAIQVLGQAGDERAVALFRELLSK